MNQSSEKSHLASQGMKSTLIGILINFCLAAVKLTAGVLGNSYALIADAIESSSDIVSSMIVWYGLKVAARPPDANHPYGHGKAEPMAAVVVSLTLLGAALLIAKESVQEIITPHHAPAAFTLIILVMVVATKETLFRYVVNIGESVNSTAVKADAWHHRSDAITSIAAFIGISIATVGGRGYESADDWAALFASAIIAYNAYRIFRPALLDLTDAAQPAQLEADVRQAALSVQGVSALDKCLIRKMGFEYYVDLHVMVVGDLSVRQGHDIAHRVKDAIRRQNTRIAEVLVHIEPSHPEKEREIL